MSDPLVIDCEQCAHQHTEVCDDCVVTFICNREPGEAVIIELSDMRSMRSLARSGLVPDLRHENG